LDPTVTMRDCALGARIRCLWLPRGSCGLPR
jgi:hypothetical protein